MPTLSLKDVMPYHQRLLCHDFRLVIAADVGRTHLRRPRTKHAMTGLPENLAGQVMQRDIQRALDGVVVFDGCKAGPGLLYL